MKRIVLPLAVFLLYLAVIGLGSTSQPLAKTADLALLWVHLGWMAVLSVLVVRDRWTGAASSRERESMLWRIRCWMTDEHRGSRGSL